MKVYVLYYHQFQVTSHFVAEFGSLLVPCKVQKFSSEFVSQLVDKGCDSELCKEVQNITVKS